MINKKICFSLIFFLSTTLLADTNICFNKKTAFSVTGIDGWTEDYVNAKKLGLCVLYVVKGYNFDNSPAIFYPNLADAEKNIKNEKNIESFIKDDLKHFQSKNTKITKSENLNTKNSMKFFIRNIVDGPPPNEFESIAYAPADESVFMGVISARNSESLKKYNNEFLKILENIKPLKKSDLFNTYKELAEQDSKKDQKFEGQYIKSIGPNIASSMKACVSKNDKGFKAIFRISEDGTLEGWISNGTEDSLSVCVRKKMTGIAGAKPPFSPFHILFSMELK